MLLRLFSIALLLSLGWGTGCAEPAGKAAQLIKRLKMQKIPEEGAWFAVTYKSEDMFSARALPRRYKGKRAAGTAIYGLITNEDFSALHRLKTDEIWHFYAGDPLEMLLLHPDGRGETVVLGPDVLQGQRPQFVVPRGTWQGARPLVRWPSAYCLFGDTLAPGFEFADFEMGYRDELQKQYPRFAEKIKQLTRPEFVSRPQP